MGRDHSPRERQRQQLAREQGRRASHDRILIVTEGSRTEPGYFLEIRSCHRLNTANVVVLPSADGTSPGQVVAYAKRLFEEGNSSRGIWPRAFEQVYAVFDRDEHAGFDEALRKVAALDGKLKNDNKQGVRFQAVVSVPCFELWLLIHYEEVGAAIHRKEVQKRLLKHMPDYTKGASDLFSRTQGHLDDAMKRAASMKKRLRADDWSEPFTDVDVPVRELLKLVAI